MTTSRRARSLARVCALAAATTTARAQQSPYLYGIHDHDTGIQEFLNRLSAQGVTGWVTATVAIGSDPGNHGGDDFRSLSDQGHGVIVRLNNGYCGTGTLPTPDRYDAFAQRAANYVAATRGADIFVVGNETNLAIEWAPVNGHARYVSPQEYALAFRKVYNAIKAARPDAKVLPQALAPFAGPYPAGSTCGFTHDANPLNWVQYMNQMLGAIAASGGVDGIALHINSRGYTRADIHSTQKVSAGGQQLYFSFYVYKDWVDLGIPASLRHLPLYATESNGIHYWSGGHPERPGSHYEPGWIQEVYAEIDRYNRTAAATGRNVFRAVNLYRWCRWCDGWNIDGSPYKGQILADLDQAASARYRWTTGAPSPTPTPTPAPTPGGTNVARGAVAWSASSVHSAAASGDRAYDGVVSAGSKWTSDGRAPQSWLALDLGALHRVAGFVVRHAGAGGEPAYFNTTSFRIEAGASLAGPWSPLASVVNAAASPASTVTLATPAATRFVRLFVTDAGIDDYARIPELEVYGTLAPPEPPPGEPEGQNLSRGATRWAASSSFNGASGGDRAYDGVISAGSKWTSDGSTPQSWLALDLSAAQLVTGFVVQHAGAGGEPDYFNTEAYRVETGASLSGPWQALVSVANPAREDRTVSVLPSPVTARFVRLVVTDAGIDQYARIPELEVWGHPAAGGGNLVANGDFAQGLAGWSVWNERGATSATTDGGQLRLQGSGFNGGVYQQFDTGGAGAVISIDGLWGSDPTRAGSQWSEVLILNGPRLPVNGQDLGAGQGDVVLVYKNDTWLSPQGWSGAMAATSPAASTRTFVAADRLATIVLKSGNVGGALTGTCVDDVVVRVVP